MLVFEVMQHCSKPIKNNVNNMQGALLFRNHIFDVFEKFVIRSY